MSERSERDIRLGCSPRRGEALTGAPRTELTFSTRHVWMAHQ